MKFVQSHKGSSGKDIKLRAFQIEKHKTDETTRNMRMKANKRKLKVFCEIVSCKIRKLRVPMVEHRSLFSPLWRKQTSARMLLWQNSHAHKSFKFFRFATSEVSWWIKFFPSTVIPKHETENEEVFYRFFKWSSKKLCEHWTSCWTSV